MIERNKYGRAVIRSEVDGNSGSAEVCFIENDGYNAPHWAAFISVPWQDSKWERFSGVKTEEEAIEKAQKALEYRLSTCHLCG